MNKFLEYLIHAESIVSCDDFEEVLQFFEIMKNEGFELEKAVGGYNFYIDDNKQFKFIEPNFFREISFFAVKKYYNDAKMFTDANNNSNHDTSCLWNGMTMEEAHRKMWNDLADNKVKSQREWIDIYNTNNEEAPTNCCFVCETSWNNNGFLSCSKCPLIVKDEKYGCLLRKWDDAEGFEKFKLAHEIANLPWKEVDK